MKMIALGLLLMIVGGVPLFVGIDLSAHSLVHSASPDFHNALLAWVATWMPLLSDTNPANCLNNIAYLLAIGCVMVGVYTITKVIS